METPQMSIEAMVASRTTATETASAKYTGEGASCSPDPDIWLNRLSLTKRGKRGTQATAWMRFFGEIDMQLRIVNGRNGLFVALPSSASVGPSGKAKYSRRVKFINETFQERVETLLMAAYREQLRREGKNAPLPTPDDYDDYDLD